MVEIGKAISEAIETRIDVATADSGQAVRVIGEHIAAYLEGGADLGGGDVELGKRAGLNVELIQERWSVAKEQRARIAAAKPKENKAAEAAVTQIVSEKVRKVVSFKEQGLRILRRGLKVVDQREPEERMGHPLPKVVEIKTQSKIGGAGPQGKKVVALVPASPLGFQHSKSPTGIPASLENAIIAITMLGFKCRYDLFHDKMIIEKHECGVERDQELDNVALKVRQIVLERYGFDPGIGFTIDALTMRALDHRFDPVRDYLDSLSWDGEGRVDTWLMRYCGAEDTPLNRAIGRKLLIAAVRRVRVPGVKFDYIVVLEGKQGVGKSTLLKILAGEENFSDAEILGAGAREQQESVQGVWIYELAELEGLNRSDVTHVKLFASKTYDKARKAYARARSDQPRRCVFVATTNEQTYLRDRTGNRRFWPVEVGVIDLKAAERDRDQLWAEASMIEAGGEGLVIDRGLWSDVEAKQRSKSEVDPWENIIISELARLMRITEKGQGIEGFAKAADIQGNGEWRVGSDYLLSEVLEVPKERQNNNQAKRLAAVMRDLDWHHPEQALRIGKLVKRGFVKPCVDQIIPEN